jgi:hypothetical protein
MRNRKKFARAAALTRRFAEILVLVLTIIKLIVDIASKGANCDVRKLRVQVSDAR